MQVAQCKDSTYRAGCPTRVWAPVGKVPWRRGWLPTRIFLPRDAHGQRSLVGYSLWVTVRHDWATITSHFTLFYLNAWLALDSGTSLRQMLKPLCYKFIKCKIFYRSVQFRSVTQSYLSLRHHRLQHTRPSCPSPAREVYWNSCLSSQWRLPTISSSVVPFSSRLQSLPASGSFPMSQFFESGRQVIVVSASASVLPMNILGWFPLGWNWLDLLAVQGTLKSLLQHHSSKAPILWHFYC